MRGNRSQFRTAIISWVSPETWIPLIDKLLGAPTDIAEWLSHEDQIGLSIDDDEAWIDLAADVLCADPVEMIQVVADSLEVMSVRAYHGCRPVDVSSYYRRGLRVMHPDEQVKIARDLLSADPCGGPILDRLDARAKEIGTERVAGRVWLALDHRFLVRYCGHYLIYGSEYLQGLLAERQNLLLKRGRPTIFKVNFPISYLYPSDRDLLARHLLRDWTQIRAGARDASQLQDFGWSVRWTLPPEMIVEHFHPTEIPCPQRPGFVWRAATNRLEWEPHSP